MRDGGDEEEELHLNPCLHPATRSFTFINRFLIID
jgi:hypothetical protein